MIEKALQTTLAADAALAALLGSYQGAPAIFIGGVVPNDFVRSSTPYIVVGNSARGPYLDGDRDFFEVTADMIVMGANDADPADVEAAAVQAIAVVKASNLAPPDHASAGKASVEEMATDDLDDLTFGRRVGIAAALIELA